MLIGSQAKALAGQQCRSPKLEVEVDHLLCHRGVGISPSSIHKPEFALNLLFLNKGRGKKGEGSHVRWSATFLPKDNVFVGRLKEVFVCRVLIHVPSFTSKRYRCSWDCAIAAFPMSYLCVPGQKTSMRFLFAS